MRNMLQLAAGALLMLSLACSDNDVVKEPFNPGFTYEDLADAWRGNLDSWYVENSSGKPSYTLENVNISLIMDTERYWLQLTHFTDSLEYQYLNRGFWLWDPSLPDVIYFELYFESSSQVFNPQKDLTPADTLDGSGGGNNQGGGTPPDTILTSKGDDTQIEEVFSSIIEFTENQLRLYEFEGYFDPGDITLDRF
ncbi:MAG: hypothetical protein FVQ81_15730 [Candidatus Glassbacteria bacterium]|nr:hypothetical protein [Candidatus Glassbacteria bacterium]